MAEPPLTVINGPVEIKIMAEYGCWAWDEKGVGTCLASYFPDEPRMLEIEEAFDEWNDLYEQFKYDEEPNEKFDWAKFNAEALRLCKLTKAILRERIRLFYRWPYEDPCAPKDDLLQIEYEGESVGEPSIDDFVLSENDYKLVRAASVFGNTLLQIPGIGEREFLIISRAIEAIEQLPNLSNFVWIRFGFYCRSESPVFLHNGWHVELDGFRVITRKPRLKIRSTWTTNHNRLYPDTESYLEDMKSRTLDFTRQAGQVGETSPNVEKWIREVTSVEALMKTFQHYRIYAEINE